MSNLSTKKRESGFSFAQKLLAWYDLNKRTLPWRQTGDPYYIWLSEIILQQTRVDQGIPYYLKFVEVFPRIELLAVASEDEVLRLWQGLGYYSRARNLHAAAQYVVGHAGGVFPRSHKEVLSLKGVGEYTAAAIVSFAYNEPYAVVDGNVFRVLSRVFGVGEYIDTAKGKKVFSDLAAELLDRESPGLYNQAIMDFGALQCVPKSPACGECPFADSCFAYIQGLIEVFPRKKGKIVTKDRFFNYLDIRVGDSVFLRRRTEDDIWKGLYEFPLIESEKKMSFEDIVATAEYKKLLSGSSQIKLAKIREMKHVLSHRVIHATFYRLEADSFGDADCLKIDSVDVGGYAVSRLIEKYLGEE